MIDRLGASGCIPPRQIDGCVRQAEPGVFVMVQPRTRTSALEHGIAQQVGIEELISLGQKPRQDDGALLALLPQIISRRRSNNGVTSQLRRNRKNLQHGTWLP